MGESSILNVAYDGGYDVDMVVPVGGVTPVYLRSKHTNAYLISRHHQLEAVDYEMDEFARLLDLTLFRISPHYLKRYVYNDQSWLIQPLLIDTENKGLTFFSHTAFLGDMATKMSADRARPVYKVIHLMLSHKPMVATDQCDYAGRVLQLARENVLNQSRCALISLLGLFDRMKQLGIYENSTIVLMGDHGAGVPPKGLKRGAWRDSVKPVRKKTKLVSMAIPLMAIKPAGSSGPLEVSTAQTSIAETATTIASLLRLDTDFEGTSFFDLDPNATRTRKHYAYKYSRSEWTSDYLAPIQEFLITGSPFDAASWHRGVEYLPRKASESTGARSH
jgi:hypothetical protein